MIRGIAQIVVYDRITLFLVSEIIQGDSRDGKVCKSSRVSQWLLIVVRGLLRV